MQHHTASWSPRTAPPPDRAWSAADKQRFSEACREAELFLSGTRHSADLLRYFKYLVARGFETGSFVETQPKLAGAMGVTTRTIREWDNHLDRLGLTWRTKAGVSYRRHITRFDPPPAPLDETAIAEDAPSVDVAALTDPDELLALAAEALAAGDQARGQALAFQAAMAKAGLLAEPQSAPFFAPDNAEDVIRSERNDPSDSSLKQNQAPGGGGRRGLTKTITAQELAAIQELPSVQKLQAMGSTVHECWAELAQRPIAEIDLACKLALAAPWADDKAAVAIYFARKIAAGLIPLDEPAAPTLPADTPAAGSARDSPAGDEWSRVLAALREQLPANEFDTWLAATSLVQLDEQLAVVGTPNIFAREQVAACYAPLIAEALGGVAVEVVIDSQLGYGGGT